MRTFHLWGSINPETRILMEKLYYYGYYSPVRYRRFIATSFEGVRTCLANDETFSIVFQHSLLYFSKTVKAGILESYGS